MPHSVWDSGLRWDSRDLPSASSRCPHTTFPRGFCPTVLGVPAGSSGSVSIRASSAQTSPQSSHPAYGQRSAPEAVTFHRSCFRKETCSWHPAFQARYLASHSSHGLSS